MVTTYEGDYEMDNLYDGLEDVRAHNGERITMGFEEALRHLKGNVNVRRLAWPQDLFLSIQWYTLKEGQFYLLFCPGHGNFLYGEEDINAQDWVVV